MKYIFTSLILFILFAGNTYAQSGRGVSGQLIDSTQQSLPGSTVKLKTDLGDSTTVATDVDGKFSFTNIKGTKIKLYISSFGYQGVIKNYTFSPNDNSTFVIPPIVLKSESRQLKEVTIVGINPIKFKEDTIDYKISAYPVRENAPVEDVLKKMPGVEVDAAGNVTTQGKSVTRIRINGKDFMGGDVQSATKNLPADILESIQVIDDYGDQANLTGVRTGEPNKILNLVIRNDKNYGYSLQATAGAGRDLLPENEGIENNNRYTGSVNFFNFKGNRQITVLGNINNTNTNTFNFGGGNRGGGGGGRGGGEAGVSNRDGITIARAIGTNYRDQWGQFISVYGSYSYSNNSTFTQSSTLRTNSGQGTTNTSQSTGTENPENHRFNFNLEYKPDTINYLKVSPTFTYSGNNANSFDNVLYRTGNTLTRAYNTTTNSNSSSPNFNINALYNHRFGKQGRNFSFFVNAGTSESNSYNNPVTDSIAGRLNVPRYQAITNDNRTKTLSGTASWLEPIGKASFIELNYSYNYSNTTNNKHTVGTSDTSNAVQFIPKLSNNYQFSFITNKIGLNYRVIETNYNYTLGLAVQPSTLEGNSVMAPPTKKNQFNYIPAARFLYNFSRNQSLSINYNGTSQQPSFNQLQPVRDLSNASYPVEGNPQLEQAFNNSFFVRYNSFGIESGNTLFINASFNKIDNYIATRTTSYGNLTSSVLTANPDLRDLTNTTLTRYLNTDGYVAGGLRAFFSKPWDERKYTLSFNANVNYAKYPGFVDAVDSLNNSSPLYKNISKTLTLSPGMRFRLDLKDIIDAQVSANYNISKTENSLTGFSTLGQNVNVRSLNLGVAGKNYFGDWTVSYDYSKQINSGYAIPVTNPNILSAYVERRFLKQNMATIRLAAFDLFNQNTGFSVSSDGASVTQTSVNRLGRYFMLTFALRLQKFAGKSPQEGGGDFRRGEGGRPGGGGPDRPRGGFGGGGF